MLMPGGVEDVFRALERHLREDPEGRPVSLVVLGGAALMALGFVSRATRDVDILGEAVKGRDGLTVRGMVQLPPFLKRAVVRVARDFGLPEDWLNPGPASQVETGLPPGFARRLVRRDYGPYLTLYFAGRKDLIHFKLYAAVDHYPTPDQENRHLQDLQALEPTEEDILEAARWVLTQDPSPGFRMMLFRFLRDIGYGDVAEYLA